jgi:hypothetical protein
LELERLLVDVNACIGHNDVRVRPAIHPLTIRLHTLILIAELRQRHRAERSRASDRLAMVAARAPRDDGDGFRAHARRGDHNPGHFDETVHMVCRDGTDGLRALITAEHDVDVIQRQLLRLTVGAVSPVAGHIVVRVASRAGAARNETFESLLRGCFDQREHVHRSALQERK